MKKKFLALICAVLLLTVLTATLFGCNKYEWNTISGGDPTAEVLSNGGYVVKQGNHVYFLNGFSGTSVENNEFGSVFKQGIMRATLNDDGSLVENSFELVVPKHVYSEDPNSGFAIFGEWIYYATFNYEKDRSGKPSTTNLDFMRTKIDGSVTQKIYTLGARNYPFIFTPTRILYYNKNVIYAIDFTQMKSDKSSDKGANVYRTELASGVTSYTWTYGKNYSAQNTYAAEYVAYTIETTVEAQNFRYTNELILVKADGTNKTILAKFDTYTTDYKLKLLNMIVENDSLTLYYTKTKMVGSTETVVGVFMNKVAVSDLIFNVADEKQLTVVDQSSIIPISYEKGALVTNASDSNVYYLNGTVGTSETYSKKIIGRSAVKVQYVGKDGDFWYVYYTEQADASKLYRINLIENEGVSANETVVLSAGKMKIDWNALDFVITANRIDLFFFNIDDYNYLYRTNIAGATSVIDKGELFGVFTEADTEAKKKAEEAAAA